MKILSLDTSTDTAVVGFAVDGKLLASLAAGPPSTHAELLLPNVESVLRMAQIEQGALDAIAVGIGPGSFTGTRVGVATAKGLAFALNIPIVGIGSLDVLAWGAWSRDALVVPMLDAYRNEVYCAAFATGEDITPALDPFHAEPQAAMQRLARQIHPSASRDSRDDCSVAVLGPKGDERDSTYPAGTQRENAATLLADRVSQQDSGDFAGQTQHTGRIRILGSGWRRYEALCGEHAFEVLPSSFDAIQPAALAYLAELRLARSGPDDPTTLEPHYVRPPDAILPKPFVP